MKRENNKKIKKRKRNQNRSLTCRVLSMMFAIVLFCSTVLINTSYVSQASSFDDMVDMVAVEEDSAAVDISEETGDDLGTDVNFESEESTDETYSESDDLGSSDADFSSGENMFTDGTSESSGSAPAEEAAQPVSCIVNLKNETIEIKAEAPAGVLPNGTQMIVKAVENNTEDAELTDQYNKLAAKITEQLQSQGKNLDGFFAYNVSFTDADGNPVEPAGKVTYSFIYKEASSPELTDPAASTVTAARVRTSKETSELEVTELKAEENQLTVETNESRQLTKAAFQAAGTDTYTFVWSSTPAADDNENTENNEENGEVNNEEVNADTNTENTEENGEETNTENNVENSEEEQNQEETPDQEQTKMIRVIADEVNLRVVPSTEAEVIATVDTDTQLPLLETVTGEDEFTWYKVSYEEAEAYVRSDMAEVVENEEQGTENEAANEEEAEVQIEEVTYSQTIDNVVVTATAAKDVLPENAQFVVNPIKSEDAQYEDIAARLEEKAENEEYSIAGFLAYDIYFLNSAGEKINPEDGKVKISMEYQNATAPEEVKESDTVQMDAEEDETSQENTEAKELSVSVMHFVEENGEVTSVVDMTKENSATVETNEAGEVQKAEFETESFSTFTITWKKNNGNYKNLRVHLVYLDDNGEYKEIPGTANKYYNVLADAANIELAALGATYTTTGYQYSKALAQDKITGIAWISYNSSSGGKTGWFGADANKNWAYLDNDGDNYNIYLVYKILSGVLVMDKIADDGSLEAKYTPENNDTQTTVTSYEWYKSDSEKGEYTKVEKINYQAGTSTVSNISDDGAKLYPAYDGGARKWYKVKVTLSDNTTIVESSPYQVAYYNQLQNGSFEDPTYSSYSNQISNENYATNNGVWQTTGTNNGRDIEIVRQNVNGGAGAYDWWTEPGNDTSLNRDTYNWANAAYEGSQFAELNCEAAGALYQDVLTIPGTSLNYWLAHRARGTNADSTQCDTMYLVIMPKSAAVDGNGYELTTQTQLEEKLTKLGCTLNGTYNTEDKDVLYDQNGIKVLRVTSTNQRWQYINALNGYTPTSSLTRFFFMSGKTASKDNTVGNFLDQVGFSQELPPVADDEFTLQIKKNFEGLGNADIDEVKRRISFKITASQNGVALTDDQINALFGCNTIYGSEMTQQLDGSLQYTIANRKIGVNDIYQVTITEENAGLSGYTLNTSSTTSILTKNIDTPEVINESTFGLQGKKTATVTFTNTYEADNQKKIHFTKIWDDNNNDYGTRPDSLAVTLHATYDANGQTNNLDLTDLVKPGVTITLNAASKWKCSWTVPVYYTLGNGNKEKINYTVTEGENTSDYVYEAVTNDGKAISGDGSKYHYKFNGSEITTPDDTTSAQSAPRKSRVRAASNNDELATVADTNGTTTSDLGEPAHTKYITYNSASGDYTLHLDVTGAKGSAKGVDVLFVVDTSGSMGSGYNNLLPTVKTLLTKDGGLVDKIFSKTGNVNNVAMVSFSDKNSTNSTSWYGTSSKNTFKNAVNALSASGGTNWTYAMVKARELLDDRSNSSNEKVVIFLSDGKPTYSCEKKTNWFGQSTWEQTGNGSKTKKEYYTEAANQVTGSLASAKMYSVYLTSDTKDGMETFSEKLKNSELVDGTRLENALTGILNKVIPTYKNVTITDTLSDYVAFAETSPTITVTKKNATGTTTLTAGTDYTPNCSGKTVTVQLLKGNSLEDGATYTVSFRVKPSDAANDYYKNHQSYPNKGDAGTGTTSAGKDGFYSNNNDETKISYEIDGTSDGVKTASYIRPVVQVTTHTLTYTKKWNYPSGIKKPTQDVKLNVTYSDGTTEEITLTNAKDYTYQEESVPVTKYIVNVTETPVADYEASYSITDNGTNAVVTNNYNKVTASNITVTKVWNGGGPQPAITVGLYRSVNGEAATKIDTVTLSSENDWSHTWNELPKSEGNTTSVNNYSYAVREESIPSNYQSSISYKYGNDTITATITNTYDPNCADENYYIANVLQTEKLHIIKKWEDNSNEAGKRPTDLSVNVNGMNFTLSSGNQWTQDAIILKKKNPTYNATENLTSPDYQMISSTVTSADDGKNIEFVNQLKTKEITVHKEWKDGNAEGRPESVTIRLDRRESASDNWKPYDTYTFTGESVVNGKAWTYVIPRLLTTYQYRVVELNDNGEVATAENNGNYIPSITQSEDGDTFTITNTLKWSAVKKSAEEDGNNTNSVVLKGAEFELKQGTVVCATGVSGTDGVIEWTLKEGTTVDLNHLKGTYTIHETKAPDGYMKNDKDWTVVFDKGLLISLDGTEIKGSAATGVVITLTNQKVYSLPSTGGSGIYWYMIGGMVLMSTAAWILYKNKCREVLGK